MAALAEDRIAIGDLILAEVLQGFRYDRAYRRARSLLGVLPRVSQVDFNIALASAENFRRLRQAGFTVRKTVDCLIATSCLQQGLPLLYSDRDFDPFVEHLGLIRA